jgi:hypothetical protein
MRSTSSKVPEAESVVLRKTLASSSGNASKGGCLGRSAAPLSLLFSGSVLVAVREGATMADHKDPSATG